jgi:hypothetical protein
MASVNGLPFAKIESGYTVPVRFKPTPAAAEAPKGIASVYAAPKK